MRHKIKKSTLGRKKAPREALMRNLAESLILHGNIKTTLAKAKALRTFVEPLVTKARKGDLTAQRAVRKVLYTDEVINKLVREVAPKYVDRAGGYTRIIKLGTRSNDAAEMARIEFV